MTKQTIYYRLTLVADDPNKEIWIGDDEGYFVARGVGKMTEGLMPETYMITFGELGANKHRVDLKKDTVLSEKDLDTD